LLNCYYLLFYLQLGTSLLIPTLISCGLGFFWTKNMRLHLTVSCSRCGHWPWSTLGTG